VGRIEKAFEYNQITHYAFEEHPQRSQVEQILDAITGKYGHRAEFQDNRFKVYGPDGMLLSHVHFYFGCGKSQAEVEQHLKKIKYHDLRLFAREQIEKLGVLF